ncbi:MAG: RNA methyltransferase [Bacteroidaceae bacterium]|nr:RNA methyltransferase [Bacteroidaceae bacterium]
MEIFEITNIDSPELQIYSKLTENQLRNRLNPEQGVFIAESPKVIDVALKQGYQPISLLCEKKHITGDAAHIIECLPNVPIYTGERDVLASLTGYTLTRGVLCAMSRPKMPSIETVCANASRVVVIHGVVDSTNVGAIFRSAAALGIDAILLTRNSCDPLNRRSIRVSMGSVFLIPWTWLDADIISLNQLGFKTLAMALSDNSVSISDAQLKQIPRMAIVMGTEGDGLPNEVVESADYVVKIPMYHDVDSLNVAAASAVAFWELRKVQ